MISYKDKTFCIAACANRECPRKYTEDVRKQAEEWWGDVAAPVAVIRPDGYVLVPVEPTEKMFKAGLGWRESDSELEGEYRMVYESYKAMIQAAQEEE
jgi:hypothetical protein